ncbi:MAG: hypothetical protein ACE37J_18235 [Pikeienuella sp.]|uniref:hypothetical protein n=1 Tax=Pikeienuella sp. TaxID=2831957 RepID=UPI003919DDF8
MNRLILSAAALLTACAARPEVVHPTHESALRHARADCAEIGARAAALDVRIAEVSARQEAIARDDEIAGAVGLLWFPGFLIVPAVKENPAAELAALKGEARALAVAAREGGCAAG